MAGPDLGNHIVQVQLVGDGRRLHASQGCRLHHGVRVCTPDLQLAGLVGLETLPLLLLRLRVRRLLRPHALLSWLALLFWSTTVSNIITGL